MSKKRKNSRKSRGKGGYRPKRNKRGKGSKRGKRSGLGAVIAAAKSKTGALAKYGSPIVGIVAGAALSNLIGHGIDKMMPVSEAEAEGIEWKRFIKPVVLAGTGAVLLGFSDKLKKFIKSDNGINFVKGVGGGLLVGAGISTGKILLKDKLPLLDKIPFTDGLGNNQTLEANYEYAKDNLLDMFNDNNHQIALDEGSTSYVSGFGTIPGSTLNLEELEAL